MDLQRAVALSVLPGISRPRAAAVFKALTDQSGNHPISVEEVVEFCRTDADVPAIVAEALDAAAALLGAALARGIVPVPIWAPEYPALLRTIADPPPVLWVHGRVAALAGPAVAVIGSRAATPYALAVATRLAGELSDRGVTVVSGLARGADAAAHRGCLEVEGVTVAVLGSGPDVIYPSEHRELAASITKQGALVSELGPGAPPLQEHFPQRNRLISGISLAVVVVEASEKSGSLITARCALDQNREVMAVPGSILSGRNRGSHSLLKDGAKVVESADDILEELGSASAGLILGSGRPGPVTFTSGVPSAGIVDLLDRLTPGEPYELDALAGLLGQSGPELLARLTAWEVGGRVVRLAHGRYMRRLLER
jgi:DNA processing protein